MGCLARALQHIKIARVLRMLQEICLENRKAGRKWPRLLEHRRKLGQVNEKNARNPEKKTLLEHESGARIESSIFCVKMRKTTPSESGGLT